MELSNELCKVEIAFDNTYTFQSADNKYYDYVFNPNHYTHNDFYKTLSIHIDSFSAIFDIALIGGMYSLESALLEDHILTVMLSDTISKININNAQLLLTKKIECTGCTFEITQINGGYIVYGELEILRLDSNFNKIWSFSGMDIFVSQYRKNVFQINENSIQLYDWEDNYYELDLDGNILNYRLKNKQ